MDETKAVARLPNLDIEILHRRAPDEGAEYLSISLKATPSFRAMADHLDAHALQLFNPLNVWLTALQAAQDGRRSCDRPTTCRRRPRTSRPRRR